MSEWTSGGAGFKFEAIGDGVGGEITHYTIEDGTDFDGRPERKRVLDLHTKDGEDVRLYLKRGNMQSEFAARLRENNLDEPQVGDFVAVQWIGERPSRKGNPAKVYEVAYRVGERAMASVGAGNVQSAADLI